MLAHVHILFTTRYVFKQLISFSEVGLAETQIEWTDWTW